MSITGEVPGEGFDGEEVFIDDEDIINEIPLDDEGQYYLHTCTSYLVGSTLLLLLAPCLLLALLRPPRPRR
jgi:hypothetical protein